MRTATHVCLVCVNVQACEARVALSTATLATLLVSTCRRAQGPGISKGSTGAHAAMQWKK